MMAYNFYNVLVTTILKRLANTDSSIGSMCGLMDTLMGSGLTSTTSITAKSCCYTSNSNTEGTIGAESEAVGNFMTCLSDTALSASSLFSKGSVGSCDTSTTTCGNLAPF